MTKMLRPPAVFEKAGVGRTKFHEVYIQTGRLRWIRNGRIRLMPEHELDQALQEDIAASNAAREPAKPALTREAYLKGAHKRRQVQTLTPDNAA
jgi:hypothetical protein